MDVESGLKDAEAAALNAAQKFKEEKETVQQLLSIAASSDARLKGSRRKTNASKTGCAPGGPKWWAGIALKACAKKSPGPQKLEGAQCR